MDTFTRGYDYVCRKRCAAPRRRVHICPKMIPPADVDIGRAPNDSVCRKRSIRDQTTLPDHDQNGRPNYKNQRNEQTIPFPGNPNAAMLVQRDFASIPGAARYGTSIDLAFFAVGVGFCARF